MLKNPGIMFSNDRNIETIGQLVEVLKHYIGLQKEFVKLDVIEKIVRLLTALIMTAILAVLLLLVLIYLSFAAAYAMEPYVGTAASFSIIAVVYIITFILFILFRQRWVERPLVRFLAGLLMN